MFNRTRATIAFVSTITVSIFAANVSAEETPSARGNSLLNVKPSSGVTYSDQIPVIHPQAEKPATGPWKHLLRARGKERLPIESIMSFEDHVVVKCDGYKTGVPPLLSYHRHMSTASLYNNRKLFNPNQSACV